SQRSGRVALDAQLLNPVADVGVSGVALPPEPHISEVRLVDYPGTEGVDIAQGELQIVVGLDLIEAGKRRREGRSHALIKRSVDCESAPKTIFRTQLVIDARRWYIVIGKSFGRAEIIARGIGAVRNWIQP